jgi:hypothetical protein
MILFELSAFHPLNMWHPLPYNRKRTLKTPRYSPESYIYFGKNEPAKTRAITGKKRYWCRLISTGLGQPQLWLELPEKENAGNVYYLDFC